MFLAPLKLRPYGALQICLLLLLLLVLVFDVCCWVLSAVAIRLQI